MEATKKVADKLGIKAPLRLGVKTAKGVRSTGPHTITFVSDALVDGIDPETGASRQELEYVVEEKGQQFVWSIPLFDNKTKKPHYLIKRLMNIKSGDKAIVELMKFGIKNYVDVQEIV